MNRTTQSSIGILILVSLFVSCSDDPAVRQDRGPVSDGSKPRDTAVIDSRKAAEGSGPGAVGSACKAEITALDAATPNHVETKNSACPGMLCLVRDSLEHAADPVPYCTKPCASAAECGGSSALCPGGFICGPYDGPWSGCCSVCLCKGFLKGGVSSRAAECEGKTPSCP